MILEALIEPFPAKLLGNVTVRSMTKDDIDASLAIYGQWTNAELQDPQLGFLHRQATFESFLQFRQHSVVAELGGKIAGYCVLRPGGLIGLPSFPATTPIPNDTLFVQEIAVGRDYLRMGIGKALYAALSSRMRKPILACPMIAPITNISAHRFHNATGFEFIHSGHIWQNGPVFSFFLRPRAQ